MSTEMTLESDARLTRETVLEVLNSLGLSDVTVKGGDVVGSFPASGTWFFFREVKGDQAPTTTGMEDAGWRVGGRMVFRFYLPKYEQCKKDLGAFVVRVSEMSKAWFLVAFQYEVIVAIRDDDGLRWLSQGYV